MKKKNEFDRRRRALTHKNSNDFDTIERCEKRALNLVYIE